jgi:hypothetical protein
MTDEKTQTMVPFEAMAESLTDALCQVESAGMGCSFTAPSKEGALWFAAVTWGGDGRGGGVVEREHRSPVGAVMSALYAAEGHRDHQKKGRQQ